MGRRHQDIKAAVAEAGLHAVLPALVLHGQQLTENFGVRRHAPALQLSVDGVPHTGGSVAVGVDPLAARDRVQFRPFGALLPEQVCNRLPGPEILLFQRFFHAGKGVGQAGERLRAKGFRPEIFSNCKPAAAKALQQGCDFVCRGFGPGSTAGGSVQRALFPGQLLGHGVEGGTLSAGRGRTVGGQIGPAGFGLGVLGRLILGVQGFQLAVSGLQMALPGGIFPGIGSGTGQQGRAPVHKGGGLFFGGFPAIVHDGLQRGGTGLGFGQHRVEVFQLHTVALQGIQV